VFGQARTSRLAAPVSKVVRKKSPAQRATSYRAILGAIATTLQILLEHGLYRARLALVDVRAGRDIRTPCQTCLAALL